MALSPLTVIKKITVDVSNATPVVNAGVFHASPDLTIVRQGDAGIAFTDADGNARVEFDDGAVALFEALFAIGETGT